MNADFLTTLENVFWVLGTLAGIVAAWFKLRSTWMSKQEDREALRAKYRARWQRLEDGRYLKLPERGVRWLLRIKGKPAEWSEAFMNTFFDPLSDNNYFIIALICIPGAVSIWILHGMAFGILASVVALIFIGLFGSEIAHSFVNWIEIILIILLATYVFASCILVLQLALSLEIYWTALILLVILPIYAVAVIAVVVWYSQMIDEIFSTDFKIEDDAALNLSIAFTLSFFITAIALLIGSFAAPGAYIPQTVQMFLVNVLCDGITLLLTFSILGGAVNRIVEKKREPFNDPERREIKKKYPIPVAIALDIVVAALLACLSLYLGLLGSDNALSINETVNVLIARAPSGNAYELGPYFWAMHTTFIPTLLYVAVIALAYVGKLIILPIFHVLKKGHGLDEKDNPHDLTAAVFTFVAFLFLALAGLLSRITPEQVTQVLL